MSTGTSINLRRSVDYRYSDRNRRKYRKLVENISCQEERQYFNMSEEKSIRIIEFSGKQSDWGGWSEKFLTKAEMKE